MALARAPRRDPLQGVRGRAKPRICPPTPARSQWRALHELAAEIGIGLWPWQDTAARYLYALGSGDTWLYPETCVVVARQNGKTEILVPHITKRLLMGRRIMHTAQDRRQPREVFLRIADVVQDRYPELLASKPRFANGQEEIRFRNGGGYRIVAPTRSAARGPSNDDLIIDEVREVDPDFMAAGKPTLSGSANPQALYLSNAGDETSDVLNALKRRAEEDNSLAYLEWSAAPERAPDDIEGWRESNPAIGHMPQKLTNLRQEYRAHLLGDQMAIFETEYLCRWVITTSPPILGPGVFEAGEAHLANPTAPVLGLALDQSGKRASGVIAWQQQDGSIGFQVIADVIGDPVDLDLFGPELRDRAMKLHVFRVVFDPYDEHLARHFRKPIPMNGRDYANACATFAREFETGRLHWQGPATVGEDLRWTTRRATGSGAWMAVKAKEDHPVTAALAAIRAVGLLYGPRSSPTARIY